MVNTFAFVEHDRNRHIIELTDSASDVDSGIHLCSTIEAAVRHTIVITFAIRFLLTIEFWKEQTPFYETEVLIDLVFKSLARQLIELVCDV